MNFMERELGEAFEENELVVTCCISGCHMHRLKHWEKGVWIYFEKKEYWNYTHSYCKVHHFLLEKDLEEYFLERAF